MPRLLLVGRFHAVTRPQAEAIARAAAADDVTDVVAVITAADQSGTPRQPLPAAERRANLAAVLASLGKPVAIAEAEDVADPSTWAAHLGAEVRRQLGLELAPAGTRVVTATAEVARLLAAAGYELVPVDAGGVTPAELLAACGGGRPWEHLAPPALVERFRGRDVPARLARLFAGAPGPADGEVASGRDYQSYGVAMDAALTVKLDDLGPFVAPGVVVDLGCGTGSLLQALSWRHRGSAFVGVDLSRDLLRQAEGLTYGAPDVRLVRGDVEAPPLPAGTATTAIFSSVLHEVHSYGGYDRGKVRRALENAAALLRPGGRLLLRDGVRPAREDEVLLSCVAPDPSPLGTTRERFVRFSRDFKGGPPEGGVAFREEGGRFACALPDANEFLTKKDYLDHWDLEVREEFGVFSLPAWRAEVEALGLAVLHAVEYVSPWIEAHRYRGKVELHRKRGEGLEAVPYPSTNFVLAAERR